MGIEGIEAAPKPWQNEIGLDRHVTLPLLHGSDLRSTLSNDAPGFANLVKRVGDHRKLFRFEGDDATIFGQVPISEVLDDQDMLDEIAESWNIKQNDYVGYGAGNGRVGFTPVHRLAETIQSLSIAQTGEVYLFIPVPVTDDMKDED